MGLFRFPRRRTASLERFLDLARGVALDPASRSVAICRDQWRSVVISGEPQTAKELPQPQVWDALGLVKLNPPPISAVEKSSCMP